MPKPKLKQDYQFRAKDFLDAKLWVNVHGLDEDEPWYESTDETTFRQWYGETPVDPKKHLFLVAASMTLANGSVFTGAIYAYQFDDLSAQDGCTLMECTQPRIFVGRESFSFWGGRIGVTQEKRKRFYEVLKLSPESIFPIEVMAEEGCVDIAINGKIEGFYRLDSSVGNERRIIIEQGFNLAGELLQEGLENSRDNKCLLSLNITELDRAIKEASERIVSEYNNPKAWYARSIINRKKRDHYAAATDALVSVMLQADNGEAYPWLCLLLNEANLFSDCVRYARIGLSAKFAEPTLEHHYKGQIKLHLARALYENGNYQEALELLEDMPKGAGVTGSLASNRMANRNYLLRACKKKLNSLAKSPLRRACQ